MDQIKVETMESANAAQKSVINQMSTHVWNLFAKTNLFALCCVGAFLSLVSIISSLKYTFKTFAIYIFLLHQKITIIIFVAINKKFNFFFFFSSNLICLEYKCRIKRMFNGRKKKKIFV